VVEHSIAFNEGGGTFVQARVSARKVISDGKTREIKIASFPE